MAANWWQQLQLYFQGNGYNNIMSSIAWTPAVCTNAVGDRNCLSRFSIRNVDLYADLYLLGLVPVRRRSTRGGAGAQLDHQFTEQVLCAQSRGVECLGVLYAVLGTLISSINANDVNTIANGGGAAIFGGWSGGVLNGAVVMIGFISIIYALCILAIPLVAGFILRGQLAE